MAVADTETPIKRVGGNPWVIGGMCNGVEQAIALILAASPKNVFLLRFHGHGAPGVAGVSFGQGDVDGAWDERADIDLDTLTVTLPMLSRLRGIFGPYGCIQFMHCQTGRGPQGQKLLSKIAGALGVPATAAVTDQAGLGWGKLASGTRVHRHRRPARRDSRQLGREVCPTFPVCRTLTCKSQKAQTRSPKNASYSPGTGSQPRPLLQALLHRRPGDCVVCTVIRPTWFGYQKLHSCGPPPAWEFEAQAFRRSWTAPMKCCKCRSDSPYTYRSG